MTKSKSDNSCYGAEILFGLDSEEGLVAIENDAASGLLLYKRTPTGVICERTPFKPWLLLTERPPNEWNDAVFTELDGPGYHILAEFQTYSAFQAARFDLQDRHIANVAYPNGSKMAFIRTGKTLFKGMAFSDVVRMQIDIETNGLDPGPEANRILMIAVADNRGLLDILEGDEPDLLRQLVSLVAERNPDVIEGHNILGFDLPFLISRAARLGTTLPLGRDGSAIRLGRERNYAIGGSSRPFTPAYIHGRHVIDTYLIVQRFDWAKGALSSYGLKECARQFGFAAQDRIELPRHDMERLYREQPDQVREYARQDAIETQKLAELITPVEFYQTQMVPDNYGQVAITGNGEKINSIFLRAYLAAGAAVPMQQSSRPYAGGYTEVRLTGVLNHVVKADVESLYPSLMITERIAPSTDFLGVFLPALTDLTARRLDAKRRAQEPEPHTTKNNPALAKVPANKPTASLLNELPDTPPLNPSPHHLITSSPSHLQNLAYWEGLQGSFKVLINSFYGYLGGPFHWNDYAAASLVTERGRELVQGIANQLEKTGSRVIEIDTDGVYFTPPDAISDEAAERAYIAEIGKSLPEGIRLAFDGRFKRMLSLKTKNYVLQTESGKIILKGASLRSRADERYGRRFLSKAIDCLLEHDLKGVAQLYASTIQDLLERRVPIEDLARRERVTEKTFQSGQKRRSAAVAEGVAIGEHVMVYERADGSLGLLADYQGDENPKYYMDKLYKFAKRLEEGFDGQFDQLIPKPTAQGLPHQSQTTLDLF